MVTPTMEMVEVIQPVSGTDNGVSDEVPVNPIDGNLLIVGFLLLTGFGGASFVGLAFYSIRTNHQNIPPMAVPSMINPILQTTYDGWQRLGTSVRETPDIKDDIVYNVASVPFEMLVEHMRKMGFTVVKDEEVDLSAAQKNESGGSPPFVG